MVKQLLFVDSVYQEVKGYVNQETEVVLFSIGETWDQVLSKVASEQYAAVGIFSHGNSRSFTFAEPVLAGAENAGFLQFMKDLRIRTQFTILDIFACNFGQSADFIAGLEQELQGVNVRASTDETGNTPFGNWVMETDQKDIKATYFTEQIADFKQVLSYFESSMYSGYMSQFLNELKDPANARNQIYANQYAFAALKNDGTVVTWGDATNGGDSSSVAGDLVNVVKIFATSSAFAALRSDGRVVTWGRSDHGGDSSSVVNDIQSGIDKIFSNAVSFAALNSATGKLVTWGTNGTNHISPPNGKLDSNVENVFTGPYTMAALKTGGELVTWGTPSYGGDSSSVSADIHRSRKSFLQRFCHGCAQDRWASSDMG